MLFNLIINKLFETDFTIKANIKKQRRFDRSTVIFKLKSKNFCMRLNNYTIDYKNAKEILTKTLKYLHRNNTSKKNCGMNKETLSKYLRADRVTLFIQFWFKFANKKHLKNQAVKFILTLL